MLHAQPALYQIGDSAKSYALAPQLSRAFRRAAVYIQTGEFSLESLVFQAGAPQRLLSEFSSIVKRVQRVCFLPPPRVSRQTDCLPKVLAGTCRGVWSCTSACSSDCATTAKRQRIRGLSLSTFEL